MTFKIMVYKSYGEVSSFVVTDQPDGYKSETKYPYAAEFPVSLRFEQELQNRRAKEYRDYLNAGIAIQLPIGS